MSEQFERRNEWVRWVGGRVIYCPVCKKQKKDGHADNCVWTALAVKEAEYQELEDEFIRQNEALADVIIENNKLEAEVERLQGEIGMMKPTDVLSHYRKVANDYPFGVGSLPYSEWTTILDALQDANAEVERLQLEHQRDSLSNTYHQLERVFSAGKITERQFDNQVNDLNDRVAIINTKLAALKDTESQT